MPVINQDPDRTVVPRWRLFEQSICRGELASPLGPKSPSPSPDLSSLRDDWESMQSLSVAADFVCTAFFLRQFDIAKEAAEFIVNQPTATDSLREVADAYRNGNTYAPSQRSPTLALLNAPWISYQIHRTRAALAQFPRNPILWTDLSLLYTILGRPDKAMKSFVIAKQLAPTNRHVLRSGARFLLHIGMPDRAHQLILNAPTLRNDPWIAAAEVALAHARGKTSTSLRHFQRWILEDRFSPLHLSELASAIATIHTHQGEYKFARRLLRQSLISPSENAVAQAAWLGKRYPQVAVVERPPLLSFEAQAWQTTQMQQWRETLRWSHRWLSDQPFSARPAIHGSFIAARTLDDYATSASIARLGLTANPLDTTLLNNLAFSLAQLNKLSEANAAIDQINPKTLSPDNQFVVTATKGLIAFREQQLDLGRSLYRSAIRQAASMNDERQHIATAYLAMEELRAGMPDAKTFALTYLQRLPALRDPTAALLIDRLKKLVES